MSSDLPAPSAPSTHYSDDNGQNEIENGAEEELQNEGTGETFDLDTLEPVTKPLKSKAVEEKPGMFSNGSKETDEKGGAGGPSSAGPSEASRNLASGAEPPGPALKLPDSPAIPTISPPEPRKATFVLPVPSKPAAPSNGLLPRPMASLQVAKPTLSTIKTRQKVVLEPGFGPLDWERLKRSGRDLAGTPGIARYTREQLAQHRTEQDCWMAIQGKIYNITPYLKFHPGGVRELMRGAGRDATKMFMDAHAWVNVHYMLDKCLVGFLVGGD